ncbi:MAG: molybdopterin-dependent oxidoreductase [Magnetospirillum sp.]|nr:molybdopterin-dependent oxidoreductase [Magnetospirillum sp.]
MADAVRTTCPYCGTGCGLRVRPAAGGWQVTGDPDHPANVGRLCSKGAMLGETLGLESRLLHPVVDGKQADWPTAIAAAAGRIAAAIARGGPDSFAFYLSGQLLTEDYYAANKLAKGFLGTANVDTNSRLCMASAVAGHRRAFGSDTVPGCYEDLELADLVVLAGSNLAWCHPVLFQRLRKAREERGTRVVVVDPRRTDTCDIADLHLAIRPGSDVALLNGLLSHCADAGALDGEFTRWHVTGLDDALRAARMSVPEAAALCGVEEGAVRRFYGWFAATPRTVTVFSQGINQSSAGTDKVGAILNLHLATGRIGRPGTGPFSVTGQPNAMGGREVGGLANQLAAHMGFDPASVDRVRRFWGAPAMATREGLKAVDLFRAVADGRVQALWIMGTNPAVSLPEADLVRRALARCPLVIVSDCVADTDTLRFAHIRLPAVAWGEKNGTVTNSDRTVSRQRPFLPPPALAKPDWWAVASVAKALGFGPAFAWEGPADIFAEHARLSAFENGGSRDFDLGDAAGADYDALAPFQWGGRRMFGDGRFFTADGRAHMVPVTYRPPAEAPGPDFPLRLNTGRYRDQWHTMTRTGLSSRLFGHRPEPMVDIHPEDARGSRLADGGLARVETRLGTMVARVAVTDGQRPGEIFVPIHWTDRFAARAVAGRLIPGHTDPVSGQPESKHVPARLAPFAPSWFGLLLARDFPEPDGAEWWVRRRAEGACVTELAGSGHAGRRALLAGLEAAYGGEPIQVFDPGRGIARCAWIVDGRLAAVLFLAPHRPGVASQWLAGQVGRDLATAEDRLAVLAGKAPAGRGDDGPIVCACFSVGVARIERAIRERALVSVADIGGALGAGTGCGSCVPELRRLLSSASEGRVAALG